jgi:hypothetical protein
MPLITTFVELRVVAGRSRTRAGLPQAVSRRPSCAVALNGMVGAGHGRCVASVNQTRPHCLNKMGKTHSKPLEARHGRGTAWARHAMCDSGISVPSLFVRVAAVQLSLCCGHKQCCIFLIYAVFIFHAMDSGIGL